MTHTTKKILKQGSGFVAHSPPESHGDAQWHGLQDHLHATAQLAAEFGRPFGGEKAAALAGLVHDLGKYALAFQAYIRGDGPGPEHAIVGAKWLYQQTGTAKDRLFLKLLAHGVAGHHGGLPDTNAGTGSLNGRLKQGAEALDPAWELEITPDTSQLCPTGFQPSDGDRTGFELSLSGANAVLHPCRCRFQGYRGLLCQNRRASSRS